MRRRGKTRSAEHITLALPELPPLPGSGSSRRGVQPAPPSPRHAPLSPRHTPAAGGNGAPGGEAWPGLDPPARADRRTQSSGSATGLLSVDV